MTSSLSRLTRQFSGVFLAVVLSLTSVFAQKGDIEENPDSPTPILISHTDSTRALTSNGVIWRGSLPKAQNRAFEYGENSTVTFFATNLELMSDEGANAFRVYIQDANGREYRLPVLSVQPVKRMSWIYAVTVRLKDEIGYWENEPARGDVLMRLSWRGLTSNQVRLGLGEIGGKIQDAEGATPTPAPLSPPVKEDSESAVGRPWSGDRARFMEQATFGPTQMLDLRLRRIGYKVWLEEQFNKSYPSASNPYPDIPLKSGNADASTGCPTTDPNYVICRRDHYSMYPVQNWFYKEALYGDAQLRHKMLWTLSQIWVISGVDTQQSSWMIAYQKQLDKNAFGNWRTLMNDITLNPGMGNYLDMMRSTRTNPNENYAREILQLFNIGLFMLNPDGTLKLDTQGNPIPTYDQETVNNFTKVFTGWTICEVTGAQCPNRTTDGPNYKDPMIITNTANHDLTAKTLFSYTGSTTTNIAACTNCTTTAAINTYANNSFNQALDNIYNHPNVAPFVSRLLIQNFVTSDPTPAYVGRISAVFNANRSNPSQLKEVIKAILLDPEARGNVKTEPRYGKLREPVQLVTNVLRNFNVTGAGGVGLSDGNINSLPSGMGQNAFNSPTVFNYFSPDYVVPGTTVNAPEFGIYTTGTAVTRANFANTMVMGNGIAISSPNTPNGTSIVLTDLQAVSTADTTGNQLIEHLNQRMMSGAMSTNMKNSLRTAITAVPATSAANHLIRAKTAVYLIATSSQYQVQR